MGVKKKAYGVLALILAFLGAACWSLCHISGGAAYVDAAGSQSVYRLDVAKARGVIFDCHFQPLVGEEKKYVAAIAPTIESIGAVNQVSGGAYRERLAAALKEGKPFSMELSQEVESPLCDMFRVPQRYGENQLAPHVIGYLDSLGRGASGIELAMNDVLEERGGEISVLYQVDALGRVVPGGDRHVTDTLTQSRGGVALTLDKELQELVQKEAQNLEKGAVVVTEAPGCEIRALASVPDFSPEKIGEAAQSEDGALINRAFCAYPPGSVFKLADSAAMLEADFSLDSFTCTGAVNAGGMLFHCYGGKAHGVVNLEGALEKSCNCYFISAARSLGGQEILHMAYNLGLGASQEFGRGLSTSSGNLPEASSLGNVRALANFAFGQGEVTATPLQLCGMMNAVASGGVYRTPKLILGQVDAQGELEPYAPISDKALQVMSVSTASTLQRYLKAAAAEGTGALGAPKGCVSGIKTGTAQTGVYEKGEELLHFWYCGFIEDENGPRYCITVLRESTPDDKGAAARTFQRVAEGICRLTSQKEAEE